MGPADLLALVTVVFTGVIIFMCWLFVDREKKE